MRNKQIIKSVLVSVVVLLIFVIIWYLFDFALKLLDTLRNNRNFVQDLFRTLISPGFATYFAILGANKIFKTYNKKLVLYIFSSSFILFTLWALYIIIPVAKQTGFGLYDLFIQLATPIIAILTAHFTIKYSSK